MAYVDENNDDDNQSQTGTQNQSSGSNSNGSNNTSDQSQSQVAATGSSGSGVVSGGNVGGSNAPKASTSNAAPTPSSSGSWTNLNSYLNANADQASGIESQLANTINSQGTTAQNDITKLNTDFNNTVNQNVVAQNSDAVNQAVQDASTTGLTGNDLTNYQNQANAAYSGPSDASQTAGYGQTVSDVDAAQNAANETTSEAGRDVLLQNQYNNASSTGYNQGENNLDQMLLENSGAGTQLAELQPQWSNLNSTLASGVSTDNANAANAQATDTATAQAAQTALQNEDSTFEKNTATGLAADQSAYSTNYNNLVNALNNYSGTGNLALTPLEEQELGLTSGERIYDVGTANPTLGTSYISQTPFNAAAEITPAQFAEYQALSQLGASQTNPLASITPTGYSAALAGTQSAADSIDSSAFQTEVANALSTFNNTAAQNIQETGQGSSGSSSAFGSNNASASSVDNQTLANYLATGQVAMPTVTGGSTNDVVGMGTNAQGQAQNAAQTNAQQNEWAAIQAALASSGYNNVVQTIQGPGPEMAPKELDK